MSTERIVNRFPPTAGLTRDLEEIAEAEGVAAEVLDQAKTKIAPVIPESTSTANWAKSSGIPNSVVDRVVEQAAVELGLAAAEAINEKAKVTPEELIEIAKTDVKKLAFDRLIEDSGWNGSSPIRDMTDVEIVRNEIAALRSSVIKAFKHLGIDTRKFFGV